jgi:hypothetical protein
MLYIIQNFILQEIKKHLTFETLFGEPSKSQYPLGY